MVNDSGKKEVLFSNHSRWYFDTNFTNKGDDAELLGVHAEIHGEFGLDCYEWLMIVGKRRSCFSDHSR